MKNYISIGITGGIGSGKSYVCRIIETMGYPVFYSDAEAKNLITTDKEAKHLLTELFGDEAYVSGELNRPFLADKIFNDPSLRQKMNDIVHPLVRQRFKDWAIASESSIVFNEAAILFETGSYKNFEKTVLVTAPVQLRIERVMKRDGITSEDVEARMSAQWSDEEKEKLADFIIINDQTKPLLPQLVEIIDQLK